MQSTMPGTEAPTPVGSPSANSIDLRQPVVGIDHIGTALDALASNLRLLWSSALERGDFNEITRLVEASHAVHRAALALSADSVIAARSWARPVEHST